MKSAASERIHITIIGRCNSGKSSLINALTAANTAIVSDIAGTTTDPVAKAIEMAEVGAVVITDTAGTDDNSPLGAMRMAQTRKALMRTDIAIVMLPIEEAIIDHIKALEIPIIGVVSKADLATNNITEQSGIRPISVSAVTGEGLESLRKAIAEVAGSEERLITDEICSAGDTVLLVMPQDESAPKGRLIKPQVEVIRELLDRGCTPICCTPERMAEALAALAAPPKAIITDSSAFATAKALQPQGVTLTSFSILFARYKGDIELFREGAKILKRLPSTAKILIAEACSHTPQNEDIGRVKLPRLLRKKLGEQLTIDIVGGAEFPDDLSKYDLIIHCGACMFNRRHVMSRIAAAKAQHIPITNYGVAIAALLEIEL